MQNRPFQRGHKQIMLRRPRKVQRSLCVSHPVSLALLFIADNVPSPHSFEQGTGENPLLPSSGADVYRIFGTNTTLSFPDMIKYSCHEREKSRENKISMQKQDVEDIDVATFDSQLDHFVKVCRGQENPSCTGEEGLRALIIGEAIRRALDSEEHGGTVEIDS